MRLIDLDRLNGAVTSIVTCTAPELRSEHVQVRASNLCSPYRSRHQVEFSVTEPGTPGLLYAGNSRHQLWIGTSDPERVTPRPVDGYARTAIALQVPGHIVEPVVELALRLCLPRVIMFYRRYRRDDMVPVLVAAPVLTGYEEDGSPIFLLDDVDDVAE